jgi:hypothetical protein
VPGATEKDSRKYVITIHAAMPLRGFSHTTPCDLSRLVAIAISLANGFPSGPNDPNDPNDFL